MAWIHLNQDGVFDIYAALETDLDKVIKISSRLVTNIINAPITYVLTLEYLQFPDTNTQQHELLILEISYV
jgi:hypothetical protein